ncbi:MAG: diadenylate cyclase CdaA [Acidobacteriota bacterium]
MNLSLDAFGQLLQPFSSWQDLLDVLLVAVVLYNLLLLIRGTRAMQVVFGILILVVVYYGAQVFNLNALELTLDKFFLILPVAIIVLFQHEIRRALASFGRTPFWGRSSPDVVVEMLNDIVLAATTLSDRRIGGLIVFERREGLRNWIENGVTLDAEVSADLLISLFHPETPTHDGAVIIQGDRIAAAGCFLPLTRNPELSRELGTRHRAAIGSTEESDAVAVIISEETGGLSITVGGHIERRLAPSALRTLLFKHLVSESDRGEPTVKKV